VSGEFRPEGSKSLAQRMLLVASLAGGTTRIEGLPDAEDVRAARDWIGATSAGVKVRGEGAVEVTGSPPSEGGLAIDGPLGLGESGTLARFASAAVALCAPKGKAVRLVPSGTLKRRHSPALFRCLAGSGVGCDFEGIESGFAVILRPITPPSDLFIEGPGSSQEISALLIALASHAERIHLHVRGEVPSRPYLDMTVSILERLGVRIGLWHNSEGVLVSIEGPLTAPEEPLVVEPDASSAAVALAAACLSGGELKVTGLGTASSQGDTHVIEHLAAFGCTTAAEEDALVASGAPATGVELDLSRQPDLAPVMAAVAAAAALEAGQTSQLRGLSTLPGKESDRIRVLASGLSACGVFASAGADFLDVAPAREADADPGEVVLDPGSDHRMAFAFALLGLVRPNVYVSDPGCVAKSWPRFWEDLESLGATVRVHGES